MKIFVMIFFFIYLLSLLIFDLGIVHGEGKEDLAHRMLRAKESRLRQKWEKQTAQFLTEATSENPLFPTYRNAPQRHARSFTVAPTPPDDEVEDSICYVPTDSEYANIQTCFLDMYQLNNTPPYCINNASELYYVDGLFSADQTFYNCLANVPDAGSIASYWNGTYQSCWVYFTGMTLLNLVEIDEVKGVSVLQVIIDIYWKDPRFKMPLFWEHVPLSYSGVDLTALLLNDSVVMWKPLLTFPDASEMTLLSESMAMYNDEYAPYTFSYEATYALTLVQPSYNFDKYPNDQQSLVVRYAMLNYDAFQLQFYPIGMYCSHLSDGSCSFSHNPIWSWDSSQDTCTVYYDEKASSSVWPAYAQFTLTVTRAGGGLIFRLVLPITFLLLLSAVTFWLSYENRVDTTITLLLSISALYIVILQNIPMVGYLTNIDLFVFTMFVLLVLVVIAHQVYGTLQEKLDIWPLRRFYIRLIEMVGRVLLPPIIVGYFLSKVKITDQAGEIGIMVAVCIVAAFIFGIEAKVVWRIWKESLLALVAKINRPNLTIKETSWTERVILNYRLFGKLSYESIYLSQHLHDKGEVKLTDKRNFMELRKEYQLKSLVDAGERKTSGGGGGAVELSIIGQKLSENPLHSNDRSPEDFSHFSQRFSVSNHRQSEISVDSDDEHEV